MGPITKVVKDNPVETVVVLFLGAILGGIIEKHVNKCHCVKQVVFVEEENGVYGKKDVSIKGEMLAAKAKKSAKKPDLNNLTIEDLPLSERDLIKGKWVLKDPNKGVRDDPGRGKTVSLLKEMFICQINRNAANQNLTDAKKLLQKPNITQDDIKRFQNLLKSAKAHAQIVIDSRNRADPKNNYGNRDGASGVFGPVYVKLPNQIETYFNDAKQINMDAASLEEDFKRKTASKSSTSTSNAAKPSSQGSSSGTSSGSSSGDSSSGSSSGDSSSGSSSGDSSSGSSSGDSSSGSSDGTNPNDNPDPDNSDFYLCLGDGVEANSQVERTNENDKDPIADPVDPNDPVENLNPP
jgi:hypothetical protein